MRNSSSLDWLRFMHTPNDYRVSLNYTTNDDFNRREFKVYKENVEKVSKKKN